MLQKSFLRLPRNEQAWKRVHTDKEGLFMPNHYALIPVNAYCDGLILTKWASSEFTIEAFIRTFGRERVSKATMTDNGTHFTEFAGHK